MTQQARALIPVERIEQAIYLVRGQKVMFDFDLAALYGVATKALIQAVKRNRERYPADFMFQLSKREMEKWRSHFVTSNPAAKMGLRRPPYAFTEQGVAMLSSVLNSKRAIQVNVAIMRTFVRLREMILSNKELARRLDELEKKYDKQFKLVFDAIRELMEPPEPKKRPIGFLADRQ
ncbi:MAG: ORF6N domain-containing protein [bacterium]